MISLAKAAADPAGHYSRPDVTRLLLNRTPGDRVVYRYTHLHEVAGNGEPESVAQRQTDSKKSELLTQ
jgi:aliphatic nitrilase